MAKKESCLLILVKMVLMVTISIAALIVGFFYVKDKLNEFFNRGEGIEVPDFRGKKVDEALKEKPSDLNIEQRDEKYDVRYPKGCIIAQYPDPGTKVKPNKKVLLTISLGSKQVGVPNLLQKNLRESVLALLNAQLREGNRAYIYSTKTPKDRLIAQSPLPTNNQEVQGQVDMLISLGAGNPKAPLPNLAGKMVSDAKTSLLAWGLKDGKVYLKKDPSKPKFQVISTKPSPYEPVAEGTAVDLLISSGSDSGNVDADDLKRFELIDTGSIGTASDDDTKNRPTKTADNPPKSVEAPPKIIIADDEDNEDDEDRDSYATPPKTPSPPSPASTKEGKALISFVMPDGFMPKEVKFLQVSSKGREQVYSGTHKPFDLIKVEVPKTPDSKIQIYINDFLIEERQVQ